MGVDMILTQMWLVRILTLRAGILLPHHTRQCLDGQSCAALILLQSWKREDSCEEAGQSEDSDVEDDASLHSVAESMRCEMSIADGD